MRRNWHRLVTSETDRIPAGAGFAAEIEGLSGDHSKQISQSSCAWRRVSRNRLGAQDAAGRTGRGSLRPPTQLRDGDSQTLTAEPVDYREHFQWPPINRTVGHKIVGPHVVGDTVAAGGGMKRR